MGVVMMPCPCPLQKRTECNSGTSSSVRSSKEGVHVRYSGILFTSVGALSSVRYSVDVHYIVYYIDN